MKPTTTEGDSQQNQRHGDDPWGLVRCRAVSMAVVVGVRVCVIVMVRIRILVIALLAVKHQEVHPKRIERGNEDTH